MSESATDRWKWLARILPSVEYWQRFCEQRNTEFLEVRGVQKEVSEFNRKMAQELAERLREKALRLLDVEKELAEAKAALSGRTVSCVCGGKALEDANRAIRQLESLLADERSRERQARADAARKDEALVIAESWFDSYRFRHFSGCSSDGDCSCGVRGAREKIQVALAPYQPRDQEEKL